jgi:hypothetical protein
MAFRNVINCFIPCLEWLVNSEGISKRAHVGELFELIIKRKKNIQILYSSTLFHVIAAASDFPQDHLPSFTLDSLCVAAF